MAKIIDGERFKQMICAAAGAVDDRKQEINELNVFPVPDGDTGTNMSLTMLNAARELEKLQNPTLGRALEVTASGLLRGARGNSGVITSLLFRGMAKSLRACSEIDGAALAAAMTEGVQSAYKAVMKPAEGTILTVSRLAAEAAVKTARRDRDCEKVLAAAIDAARAALPETMEMNPVLKKAGVVDAGAYGWIIILDGMMGALTGTVRNFVVNLAKPQKALDMSADFSQFDTEEITFAYCTEFIAERRDKRRSVARLRAFLESLGDSVVVVDDEELVKIHVHTDNPDRALGEGLKFGPLSSIKIENMLIQHENKVKETTVKDIKKRVIAAPEQRYGFVSVAAGAGLSSVFTDLGADNIVSGGQTMNPSTEDLLKAVDKTPAEVVFILPNNKNIILAGQQAAELSEKQVTVISSKTTPQGIAAMLAFDPDLDPQDNAAEMERALENVKTGQITYAARDSSFDGRNIREGEFLALLDGKLVANGRKFDDVARKLARTMIDRKSQFITVFRGEGADAEKSAALQESFSSLTKTAEYNIVDGDQPVYSYIISVE